jgi:hypothetical protein
MATFTKDNSQELTRLSNAVTKLHGIVYALMAVTLILTSVVTYLCLK